MHSVEYSPPPKVSSSKKVSSFLEGVPLKDFHSHWSFLKIPSGKFRKILRNKSPTSWGFLASCGATNLHSMTRGYSFMPGGVFEHILARLRASFCARIPFFRGWVRIVSSFSGTSPGSTVCFCSFLAWRRARNDSLVFCALQHIKCSRSAVSRYHFWRHCRSFKLESELKI